jgi:soluble lytic murein transglycosylase-like protein
MKTRLAVLVGALAAAALLAASPSFAQLASYVDEHGKVIFINGDSTSTSHGSTIKSGLGRLSLDSQAPPPDRLERIVHEAAERHQVDPALVKAVISTESGWNPQARSRKGAVGLMQLIPQTAQRYGVGNPYDPAQNVEAGTTYLKALLDRYNGDLTKSLAAYNAGEHIVDRVGGVPPYWETQRYVQKVTNAYFRPGSDRNPTLWSAPKPPVRKEVDPHGRVVFTNE